MRERVDLRFRPRGRRLQLQRPKQVRVHALIGRGDAVLCREVAETPALSRLADDDLLGVVQEDIRQAPVPVQAPALLKVRQYPLAGPAVPQERSMFLSSRTPSTSSRTLANGRV